MHSPGSFGEKYLLRPVGQGLLQTIRALGEYKGKEALFSRQAPQVLATLRERAVIRSIESSNRIEGVTAPPARMRELVASHTEPRDRSEQEIAGYREVLKLVHASARDMLFSPSVVRQLHRDLYQFSPGGHGGKYKRADNAITETDARGRVRVRFRPVAAFATPDAMDLLHQRFRRARDEARIEPLLLIPAYVLDFLCIHPFTDGNGRMARLLTLVLLYQFEFEVGRYVSLEAQVEQTKEGYYAALEKSSRNWHRGRHRIEPWWEYFLGVMLHSAYREFEARVGAIRSAKGAKGDLVRDAIRNLPQRFRYADVERTCPNVSRPTIQRAFATLRRRGEIRCLTAGRDATWEKIERRSRTSTRPTSR